MSYDWQLVNIPMITSSCFSQCTRTKLPITLIKIFLLQDLLSHKLKPFSFNMMTPIMIYRVKSLISSHSVLSKSNLTRARAHTLQQWWKIDVYLQVACCHLSLWWSSALNSCQLPSYTLTLKHTHLLLCLKAAQPHWGGHTHQDTVLLLLASSTSSLSMSACTWETCCGH